LIRPAARWLAALGAAFTIAACNQSPPTSARPLVIASFYPLYEFTRQVAGSSVQVVSLIPPGTEPHDWEPSPHDMTRIRESRLFVYNGAGLEPWVPKLLQDAAGSAVTTVRATEGIPLISASAPRAGDHAGVDPHVWLDPVFARSMVGTIRTGLVKAIPGQATRFVENARAYTAKLERLHEAFESGLENCARRDVVTSHAAFAYLARRYRLNVVPVMGLAPESEPSPAQLASIVRFAREKKVKYIFFETLMSPRLAETLAREIGAQTLVFNPIEGVTPEEEAAGTGYLALMEQNLKNLRLALDCR
jgi:zinc transport system substrate-binding protein